MLLGLGQAFRCFRMVLNENMYLNFDMADVAHYIPLVSHEMQTPSLLYRH